MPYQDDLRRYFGEIARYAEPALTAGSAMVAEPVSGLAGLGALLRGRGVDGAVESINAAQQAMTYQPRTMEGQQGLQGLQAFLQPVGEVIQGASQNLGDKAYSVTGSPALAAAAYSAPTAFLEGLGLKGLNIARKPVSGADLYSARMGAGLVDETGEFNSLFNRLKELAPQNVDDKGNVIIGSGDMRSVYRPDGTIGLWYKGEISDDRSTQSLTRTMQNINHNINKLTEVPKPKKAPSARIKDPYTAAIYTDRKSFVDESGKFDYDAYQQAENYADNEILTDDQLQAKPDEWIEYVQPKLTTGDKKAVVKNAGNMTLYHGSPYAFDEIEMGETGGIFLTGSRESAENYASGVTANRPDLFDGSFVYEYKIKPKNPLIVRDIDATYGIDRYDPDALNRIKAMGYDAIIPLDESDYVVLDKAILKRVK